MYIYNMCVYTFFSCPRRFEGLVTTSVISVRALNNLIRPIRPSRGEKKPQKIKHISA